MNHLRHAVTGLVRRACVPLCGLALAIPAAAQGTWQRLDPVPERPPLSAVAIPGADLAVVVSPTMRILRSSDAGLTWEDRNPDLPMALDRGLNGVAFSDASTGVAVGNSHAVTRTTDGGLSWSFIPLNISAMTSLRNPTFREDAVVAIGQGLIRSTDRGETWTDLPFMQEGNLVDVAWLDDSTLLGIGQMGFSGAGTIMKSTDRGATWTWVFAPQQVFNMFAAIAVSGSNATVVGLNGVIFNSTDGGAIWARAHGDKQYTLTDVAYADANTAFAVGTGGAILRSTDGGRTWAEENSPVTVDLYGVAARGSLAIAVGDSGTILRNGAVVAGAAGARAAETGFTFEVAPNPSRGDASIGYRLPERSLVRLSLVDPLGRELRLLGQGVEEAGRHSAAIPSSGLPAGRYAVRMMIGDRVEVRPFVLVK